MKSRSFPPVSYPNARVLILGSLPGQRSLQQQQYYAHPHNTFWPIMGEIVGALPSLPYAERLTKLTKHRIALWDVCAVAIRPGSLDSDITEEEPNDFKNFLSTHSHIELIAFNGAKAAQLFKKKVLPALPTTIPLMILPSTSPAHASMRFEEKLARWRDALAN